MVNPMSLAGKRVLVTGASSGIGLATAKLAADLGAQLVLVARHEDALQSVRWGLPKSERHQVVACDLARTDSIPELLAEATRTGKLDGLVHAAGIGPAVPVPFVKEDLIDTVLRTNYYSFVALVKECSKQKNRNTPFSFVGVSSIASRIGWGGNGIYAGSKGALDASMRSFAVELAPKGFRVNTVCPGHVKTPLFEREVVVALGEVGVKAIMDKQPLGVGEPEQVAAAICFLLSDAASFITGVSLPVDGGCLAR